MEKCGSDGEVRARLYVACILLVPTIGNTAVQPARKWGMSNPDTGNSSNDRL